MDKLTCYEYEEPPPSEILAATKEMLDRLNHNWVDKDDHYQLLIKYFQHYHNIDYKTQGWVNGLAGSWFKKNQKLYFP
ncbi:MAG: hypothetical protein HQL69_04075 [Magnetococcales bacterium]|nr:hypothetical protein [Magnetococcales bacterium]